MDIVIVKFRRTIRLLPAFFAAVVLSSCGAGTKLADGQYALVKNRIEIEGQTRDLKKSDVSRYIRQQPQPFLSYGKKTVFDEGLVGVSERKILDHLRYLGFYDATVDSEVVLKQRKASVRYRIVPGERIRIWRMAYDVPQDGTFASDFYADTLNVSVRPGDWLSEESLEAESERSASVMRDKGYYGFSKNYYFFEADTLSGRDSVTLLMQVREYTRNESPDNARPLHKSWIGIPINIPSSRLITIFSIKSGMITSSKSLISYCCYICS